MPTLSVRLFGKFCAEYNEQLLDHLHAGKVQELFCYLLLYRKRSHPRETLAGILWGDNPTAQSKKCLRQSLWQLQSVLDVSACATLTNLVAVDGEYVELRTPEELWLDVAQFEAAWALAQGVRGRNLGTMEADTLKAAVQLYRGDLLEGWYQEWCLFERERLRNQYLLMLDKLMGYCEAREEFDLGLEYGNLILRLDRASERTYQRLMRLYYRAGNRGRALREYANCVAMLREELGVEPAASSLALYEQIRADRLDDVPIPGPSATVSNASNLPPPLQRLKQIQSNLDAVQRQVQLEIQAIEQQLRARKI